MIYVLTDVDTGMRQLSKIKECLNRLYNWAIRTEKKLNYIVNYPLNTLFVNTYKSSVLFMEHWQTVQIQIRHRIMQCLIRNFTVRLQNLLLKAGKYNKYHPTPLKLLMDFSNR